MLLSHETAMKLSKDYANIIGHMGYAAYKLWNICNYERYHYQEMGLDKYPDWYYQKSVHKDNIWFKSLPSQTAQEVCKLLDGSWKSFYALKKSGGIENPRPPRFKNGSIPITYMQNAIKKEVSSDQIRLSLPKRLKGFMAEEYGIHETYLYLKNKIFSSMDVIKQIRIYPPDEIAVIRLIVIYEAEEMKEKEENGQYLSIDLGLHNLMTCYDNAGKTFILGRQYLSLCQKYDKEIARIQSQWARTQTAKGVKYPRVSKHLLKLYQKRNHSVKDYLHKMTKAVKDYCIAQDIHTVVIGDMKGIRSQADLGSRINRQLHGLPYEKIYIQLEYKLKQNGIRLIKQEESYSSQCSPCTDEVSKAYARESNRKHRGLYMEEGKIYNADAVGAYNILRKYTAVSGIEINMPISGLSNTKIIKVAV